MELSQIIPHIEALIFASDKPLTNMDLVELLNNAMGFIEDRATLDQVEAAVEGIYEKYNAEFYAFELKQSGGGWQFLTKKEYHKTVAQLNGDKFLKRLSNAALETLAIIAYKQPITKSEIESIRGVNCDYAVQKLLEKDLVIIAGRNEDAVGKPLIYATSKSFMDYFGINTTDDLPKISEVLMDELVQATVMGNGTPEGETAEAETEPGLAVTENGEIIESVPAETAAETPEQAVEEAGDANDAAADDETSETEAESDTTTDITDEPGNMPADDTDDVGDGNIEAAENDEAIPDEPIIGSATEEEQAASEDDSTGDIDAPKPEENEKAANKQVKDDEEQADS